MPRIRRSILESSDEESFDPFNNGNLLSQQSNRIEDEDSPSTEVTATANNEPPLAGAALFTSDATADNAASAKTFVLAELPMQLILQTIEPLQGKMKGVVSVPKPAKLTRQAMSYVDTSHSSKKSCMYGVLTQ